MTTQEQNVYRRVSFDSGHSSSRPITRPHSIRTPIILQPLSTTKGLYRQPQCLPLYFSRFSSRLSRARQVSFLPRLIVAIVHSALAKMYWSVRLASRPAKLWSDRSDQVRVPKMLWIMKSSYYRGIWVLSRTRTKGQSTDMSRPWLCISITTLFKTIIIINPRISSPVSPYRNDTSLIQPSHNKLCWWKMYGKILSKGLLLVKWLRF